MEKKITAALSAAVGICACAYTCAYAASDIEINNSEIIADGTSHSLANAPFVKSGALYVPMDETLEICGYTLGWDSAARGTVCEIPEKPDCVIFPDSSSHIIGYKMYSYENPVLSVNGISYIDSALLEDITGANVRGGVQAAPADVIGDSFRITPSLTDKYSTCITLDRKYMFEPVTVSPENARYYAGIVNIFARKLPGVKIYNMLVPDSGEFYAPKEYYCRQTESFEEVYAALSPAVTPVRIADTLYAHAGENIYFRTDHHWTQRGAYYAWRAFTELKGESIAELSEFPKSDSWSFTGSFAKNLAEGSPADALDETAELLERFSPLYNVSAKVYDDMYMSGPGMDISLVNTSVDDYSCFISGDNPVTAIRGGAPNGQKLVLIKESMGNVLAAWAVNNYEEVYVIDMRKFYDGSFDIVKFHELTGFDDLLIESYPTTVESSDLRIGLLSLAGKQ